MHARTSRFAKVCVHDRRQRYRAVKRRDLRFPSFRKREGGIRLAGCRLQQFDTSVSRLTREAFAAANVALTRRSALMRKI
jgi:hypothetical protein